MLRRNVLSASVLLAAGAAVSAYSGKAEAQAKKKQNGLLARGVTGTWVGEGLGGGTATADVLIQRLKINPQTRVLTVSGLISATGDSGMETFNNVPFVANATLSSASDVAVAQECPILFLDIGPISLDLLGLEIDLSQIILTIVADPTGGLLGELLCAIANLLSGTGPLGGIQRLLSQLNQILRDFLILIGGLG